MRYEDILRALDILERSTRDDYAVKEIAGMLGVSYKVIWYDLAVRHMVHYSQKRDRCGIILTRAEVVRYIEMCVVR